MSKSKSKTAPSSVWGAQTPYLEELYGGASGLIDAPESALTVQGREAGAQYAGGGMGDIVGRTQEAWQGALTPGQNPYLQSAIQSASRPLIQQFQEGTLSGITDQAMGAGQMGGSRQGIAEGIAQRGLQDTLGDIATKMSFQDYSGGQDRMMQAIGQGGTMANLGMMPAQTMQQLGAQEEAAPWLNLQRAKGIIGGPTVTGGGGTSTGGTSSALGWL